MQCNSLHGKIAYTYALSAVEATSHICKISIFPISRKLWQRQIEMIICQNYMIRCEFNLAKIMCVNILRGNYFANRRRICLVFGLQPFREFPCDSRDVAVCTGAADCRSLFLISPSRSSNRTVYSIFVSGAILSKL